MRILSILIRYKEHQKSTAEVKSILTIKEATMNIALISFALMALASARFCPNEKNGDKCVAKE